MTNKDIDSFYDSKIVFKPEESFQYKPPQKIAVHRRAITSLARRRPKKLEPENRPKTSFLKQYNSKYKSPKKDRSDKLHSSVTSLNEKISNISPKSLRSSKKLPKTNTGSSKNERLKLIYGTNYPSKTNSPQKTISHLSPIENLVLDIEPEYDADEIFAGDPVLTSVNSKIYDVHSMKLFKNNKSLFQQVIELPHLGINLKVDRKEQDYNFINLANQPSVDKSIEDVVLPGEKRDSAQVSEQVMQKLNSINEPYLFFLHSRNQNKEGKNETEENNNEDKKKNDSNEQNESLKK